MVKGEVYFPFIFGNLLCGTGKIGAKNCAICENLPKKRDCRSSLFLGCILLCKEGDDKHNKESDTDDRRFHNGPGLEGGLFVHTHKAPDRPETSGIAPNIEPKPTGRAMPFRGISVISSLTFSRAHVIISWICSRGELFKKQLSDKAQTEQSAPCPAFLQEK